MDCFEPKQSCHCPSRQQNASLAIPTEVETEPAPDETALQFAETAPKETCVLREEDYNIMRGRGVGE